MKQIDLIHQVTRQALLAQGVKSFICVAVHRHGQPVGFLALDVFSRRRAWPDDEVDVGGVVSIIVLATITITSFVRNTRRLFLEEKIQ